MQQRQLKLMIILHGYRLRRILRRMTQFGLLVCLGVTIALLPTIATATLPAKEPVMSMAATPSSPLETGIQLYQAEQFAEAIVFLQQATALGDSKQQALAWNYLSLAAQKLGQWQQATTAITTSLALMQTAQTETTDSDRLRAKALTTRGHLELATGHADAALTTWKQAAIAYEQANYPIGVVGSLVNQAQALQAQGRYQQALATLLDANQRLRQQPDSPLKVTGLQSLGNTLRVVGDFQQSQQVLAESVTIARRLNNDDAIAQSLLSLGTTLQTSADSVLSLERIPPDQREQATQRLNTALEHYQQAATIAKSPQLKIQVGLSQFTLLAKTKQTVSALNLAAQLQTQLATLSPSRLTVYAYLQLAQGLTHLRTEATSETVASPTWLEIAQIVGLAVQQAKTLQDPRAESYALGSLGNLYEQTQQWSEAQTLTQDALLLAQAISADDITYRWQWQAGRLFNAVGNQKAAIVAYAQTVTSLKALRQDLVAISPEVQFSFRDSIEPIYRQYVSLLLDNPVEVRHSGSDRSVSPGDSDPNASPLLSITDDNQSRLVNARNAIESLQLAELEDFFRQACLEATPVQIDQVDPTAAVFYPIVLPDRLELILSIPNQPLERHTIAIPQSQLETTVQAFRTGLSDQESQQFLPLAQQVYDWLLRPVLPTLTQHHIKTLVFVLDGALRNVPMSALHDGQHYLVQDYQVAATPGLQLIDVKPLKREGISALLGGLSKSRQGYSELPYVEQELAQISQQIPHQVLLNETFFKTGLQQTLATFPGSILHLATHGEFSSNAENTFILMWDDRLTITQLADLLQQQSSHRKQAIELLILSACRTAVGDKRAALGLSGMAVRAGARSTIGSLWYVSDSATTSLMVNLYRGLTIAALPKAEALRQAQLTMINSSDYAHPYFWSPFILVGNWL